MRAGRGRHRGLLPAVPAALAAPSLLSTLLLGGAEHFGALAGGRGCPLVRGLEEESRAQGTSGGSADFSPGGFTGVFPRQV